jgi:hypothetical protein
MPQIAVRGTQSPSGPRQVQVRWRYRWAHSWVLRNPPHLRESADRVSADLRAALGEGWSCSVDDELVLTVAGPAGTESVALVADVQDFFEPETTWSEEERAAALEQDADEVVASETLEALRALGIEGPLCPQHGRPMDACSSVWTCPEGHDGPFVGDLSSTNQAS